MSLRLPDILELKLRSNFLFDDPVEVLIVDFDQTLIRENLLIQWALFLLSGHRLSLRRKLPFFIRSSYGGLESILLSRSPSFAERAVRVAYQTFMGIEAESIQDLMTNKPIWKGGAYSINLNQELLSVLSHITEQMRRETSSEPKIAVSSQGSFKAAIEIFLKRQDVVEQMARAGIRIDPGSIIANRLEVLEGKFTGKLRSPIITKYNRLGSFSENAVFIGDNEDEHAVKQLKNGKVRFVNYRKASRLQYEPRR